MPREQQSAENLMAGELARVGFDFARPDPSVAWSAFKAFVIQAPPCPFRTATVGVEVSHVSDRDRTLWLAFASQLDDPRTGDSSFCGALLAREVPAFMWGVERNLWWWGEHGPLADWFSDVERLAEFTSCLSLPGWLWEGFSL
jgi:hypothetical protein